VSAKRKRPGRKKAKAKAKRETRVTSAPRPADVEARTEPAELTALYFPHVHIADPELVRSSLLLWDKLYYIAPSAQMLPYDDDSPPELARALDVIARPHVPSEAEQQSAHDLTVKAVHNTSPVDWRGDQSTHFNFGVYEGKFLHRTLETLREYRLGDYATDGRSADFAMQERLGLTVMAILAACCAGAAGHAVTNRLWEYGEIAREKRPFLRHGEKIDDSQTIDRLMRASFEVMDLSNVRLERLIALREKNDAEFNELRHGYVRTLREFVRQRFRDRHKGPAAANEIERQFIREGRKWAANLEKILEARSVQRRLIRLSAFSSVALAAPDALTDVSKAALGVLAAFTAYRASRFGVPSNFEIQRTSPVGYLHFLSTLR
jgi:hypothetical protein